MANGNRDPKDPEIDGAVPLGERLTRRAATSVFGALAGAAIVGCGDDGSVDPDGSGGAGGSGPGGTGGAGGAGSSSSTTATGSGSTSSSSGGTGGEGGAGGQGGEGGGPVDACTSSSDLTPQQLLAGIDTIVVLCMENRSFDHYLGALTLLEGRDDVDGLTGSESNPDEDGAEVGVYLLEDFTPEDPPHEWDEVHAQLNDGALDGFVREHGGPEVMGYHVRDQLPITYALADAGAVCDRYFCSVLGPTWPNRFYLHGGTSEGTTGNTPKLSFGTIFDRLDDAGVSWNNFYHDIPWRSGAYLGFSGNTGVEEFFERAQAGTLPNVSLIDPQFFGGGANDDHPDHHVFLGQALIASVYQALAQSPQWGRCLLVITYDEHGGFYDHVAPPAAADEEADFQQLGFRVPTLVVGPHVRRGCAVSTVFDHTSILRTLAVRWGLPNMTERMAAANDLSSCIDPAALENPHPPVRLPAVPVVPEAVFGRPASTERPTHHTELWDLAESGVIPPHLDRRADSEALTRRLLEEGVRLGAVRFVR